MAQHGTESTDGHVYVRFVRVPESTTRVVYVHVSGFVAFIAGRPAASQAPHAYARRTARGREPILY